LQYENFIAFLFLLITFFNVNGQTLKEVKTVNDILENAINALGGKSYLQSIKTLYTEMSSQMEGRQVHWITKEMLPNKGSFQIVYNEQIVFKTGTTAKQVMK
jgi:hypothetical protein